MGLRNIEGHTVTARNHHSPLRLTIITTSSIFIVEAFIMLFLHELKVSLTSEIFIDSLLLTIFIVPVLYIFLFRPMSQNINERIRAEEGLIMAKNELEEKVKERTEELYKSNEYLMQEIVERRSVEEGAREARIRIEHLLESTPVVIYSCRVEGDQFIPTYASSKLNEFMGYDIDDWIRDPSWWARNIHHEDLERIQAEFPAGLFENDRLSHEYRFKARDGSYRWIHDTLRLVRDGEGRPIEIVGSWIDITDRKEYENIIIDMAYHDGLTGLSNRRMFVEHLNQAIPRMQRQNLLAAILFLDLDRFKIINDTLGHSTGDELLKEVARRLSRCVRSSDTIARLGGDEFIILLPEISRIEDVTKLIKRIFKVLETPIRLQEHDFIITTSIGVAIIPKDGVDAETLLKKADIAMYRAKNERKNSYQFYAPDMNMESLEWIKLENKLRRAIKNEEFLVHYQPQVDIDTGELIGVEALIRWNDPETGLVPPGKFIPLAEDSGLIIPIGEWIIHTACRQGMKWHNKGINPAKISINVSKLQFKQENFVDTITKALKETGLDPNLFQIEITESIIMDNADATVKILRKLKDIGVRLAIDDFGIGYSSLGYLKSMPIDILKIDQSFVRSITADENDRAICKAIISIAYSLNMDVIAEGVETAEQLIMLQELGCKKIQGYLISRPLPADDIEVFLKKDWRLDKSLLILPLV